MVQTLSARALEEFSVHVLATYYPGYWSDPPGPLDVELFAEQVLGATLDYAPLSQDKSILGLTCFDNREVQIWSEDRAVPMRRQGQPRTILIDPDLWEERGAQSGRFTVAHEVSHILLHTVEDLEAGCSSAKLTDQTVPQATALPGPNRLKTESDWLEWQANRLGACLLMPCTKIKEALPTFAEKVNDRFQIEPDGISELANLFDVSRQAMTYRLDDLSRGEFVKVDQIQPDISAIIEAIKKEESR